MVIQTIPGGNRYFDQVWMNRTDLTVYEDYQIHQKPLMAARFESVQKARRKPNIWPEDFDRTAWYQAGTREFRWLTEGQTFDLGGNHIIETIFMPGHTQGSTLFFDWKHHILFAEMIWTTVCGFCLRTARPFTHTGSIYISLKNIRLKGFCHPIGKN